MDILTVYGPLLSREVAIAKGLRHYFTGIPCRNGHVSVRGVAKWNCLECDRKQKAAERVRDPEKVRANELRTRSSHRKEINKRIAVWREKNPDKIKEYTQQRMERLRTDAEYKKGVNRRLSEYRRRAAELGTNSHLATRMRVRINNALSKHLKYPDKMPALAHLVGCNVVEYKKNIESQWRDGMTWDSWAKDGWHIDHIVPCSAFDLRDEKQMLECFNWKNTQPLWAKENIKKAGKLPDVEV